MAVTKTQTQQPVQEIAPPPPVDNLPAARPRTNAVNAIVPGNWQEITAIASAICRARMAPKSYCNRDGEPQPDKVAIALLHGLEVGLTPMAALQSLAVINGMPSVFGDGMLALVRASGLLEDFKEEIEWDDKGPVKATCRVKRRGEPTWGVMDCARVDAQQAGWWNKEGPWRLTPHRMLQMRARNWALRDKFADVLRGLHSAEEVEDMVDVTPHGSATTGPTPPEPKRSDYQQAAGVPAGVFYSAAEVEKAPTPPQQDQPASPAPLPPSGSVEGGQPEGHVGDAPTTTSGPAAEPGPAPVETGQTQPAEQPATESKIDKAGATDVADENAIEFPNFKTARAFFAHANEWLPNPERTKAEAAAWEEHYREKIKGFQQHDFQHIREDIAAVLKLFHAVVREG